MSNKPNKNNMIAAGLASLMQTQQAEKSAQEEKPAKKAPASQHMEQKPAPEEPAKKGNYKTVCYSIPPDLAEEIKRVAYIDRRTIGAVVADAFREYLDKWKPAPEPGSFKK